MTATSESRPGATVGHSRLATSWAPAGGSGFAEAGADCRAFEAGGVDQGAIADGLVKGNGHLDAVVALAVLGLVARERFGVDPDDDVVDAE